MEKALLILPFLSTLVFSSAMLLITVLGFVPQNPQEGFL